MRKKCRSGRRWAIWALVGSATILAGCPVEVPRPARVYELTDSGVVESVEELDGGGLRVTLERGERIDLDAHAVELGSEIVPPGHLLLVGSSGSSTGYIALREREDCYVLNEPAVDDGSHILFNFGLRLPKAPQFDSGPIDGDRFPSFREGFCISSAGEVVRYGS